MMSKSVLILDTPKCCITCPFQITECNFNICIATRNDSLRFLSKVSPEGYRKLAEKPDWCPLKELPEELHNELYLDEYADGYDDGWNSLLRQITGKRK